MSRNMSINLPESLATALNMNTREFAYEVKTITVVKLYEMGKIPLEKASKTLNISNRDFKEILKTYSTAVSQQLIDTRNTRNNSIKEMLVTSSN